MKSDSLFQGQVFMGILSFKTGIEFKKKKLTDIRFFLVFPGLGNGSFQWIWILD
jgi:hypothetical protein